MILWKGGSRPRSKAYWPIRLKVPKCCAFTKISQKTGILLLETCTKFKLKDKSIVNLKRLAMWLTRLLVAFGSAFKKNVLVLWKKNWFRWNNAKRPSNKTSKCASFSKARFNFLACVRLQKSKQTMFRAKNYFLWKGELTEVNFMRVHLSSIIKRCLDLKLSFLTSKHSKAIGDKFLRLLRSYWRWFGKVLVKIIWTFQRNFFLW